MLVVPPMLPRNFLPGLSKPSEAPSNGDADSAALLYARAAASGGLSQAALMAGLSPSPAAAMAGVSDPSAALLESMLQEQRKQAILASQLGAFNSNAAASDRLGALLMQRESLLGGGLGGLSAMEQSALARAAAAGGLGAGLSSSFGLAGLGGLHGLCPSAASQLALMGAQPQLASLRDAASLVPDHLAPLLENSDRTGRKGRTGTFPQKLHMMLSDLENEEGGRDIASWLPHGRAFAIHKPKEFVKSIMPKYFRMSRFSSFQRQLNLYEFQRITEGPDKGAYFHELFLHGRPMLCTQIKRNKIKGAQGGRPANNQNAPLGPAFGVFPIPSASKATSAPSPTAGASS